MAKELVSCERRWWEFVRQLRNDPRVAAGFICNSEITPEVHERFMSKHAGSYRICLVDGAPAGFVGVVEGDIRICTHPDFQHQGVGLFMLREIGRAYPEAYGKIKVANEASRKLFEKAGYRLKHYIFERE